MCNEDTFISSISDIFIKYLFGMDTDDSDQLVLSFINADFQPGIKIRNFYLYGVFIYYDVSFFRDKNLRECFMGQVEFK